MVNMIIDFIKDSQIKFWPPVRFVGIDSVLFKHVSRLYEEGKQELYKEARKACWLCPN